VPTISAHLKKNPNPSLAQVQEACKGNPVVAAHTLFEAALAAAKSGKVMSDIL
jgi:hypothetical protein